MNIAVTGTIGSGKSSVAGRLASLLGAAHCDTDHICRQLMAKGEQGWRQGVARWGDRFLQEDGELDRPKLRRAVFSDDNLRRDLEAILHPLVREEVARLQEKARREDRHLVVEVPLLFETGWQADFDLVVTVAADRDCCLRRVMERDGVEKNQAEKALAAQMDISRKKQLADYVIDNSGTEASTRRQVVALAAEIAGKNHDLGRFSFS